VIHTIQDKNNKMKTRIVSILTIALCLAASSVHAQLGGLGGLAGKVVASAESITKDLDSGQSSLLNAIGYLQEALDPAREAAKIAAEIKANQANGTSGAVSDPTKSVTTDVKKAIANKIPLDERAAALVDKAQDEINNCIAKYALLGTAIGVSASQGSNDAALAAALVTAKEAIKDLPLIKDLSKSIKDLKKLKPKKK